MKSILKPVLTPRTANDKTTQEISNLLPPVLKADILEQFILQAHERKVVDIEEFQYNL